jgi:serine/threonine protein kinase
MLNGYVVMDTIGQGACGKVKLGFSLQRNVSVAIKVVKKRDSSKAPLLPGQRLGRAGDAREDALRREIAIMKKLRHKNIVSLYEVIDDPSAAKLYLVMQYVDRGCLGKMLPDGTCEHEIDSMKQLAGLMAQVCSGLKYLHERGIVHRDVKPENILRDSDDRAYLSDFGVSELVQCEQPTKAVDDSDDAAAPRKPQLQHVGTPLFMAPELHRVGASEREWTTSERVAWDMWAVGVTIYCLLLGRLPFASVEDILGGKALDFSASGQHVTVTAGWRSLLRSLLHQEPLKRPSADQARRMLKMMISKRPSIALPKPLAVSAGVDVDMVSAVDLLNAVTFADHGTGWRGDSEKPSTAVPANSCVQAPTGRFLVEFPHHVVGVPVPPPRDVHVESSPQLRFRASKLFERTDVNAGQMEATSKSHGPDFFI